MHKNFFLDRLFVVMIKLRVHITDRFRLCNRLLKTKESNENLQKSTIIYVEQYDTIFSHSHFS